MACHVAPPPDVLTSKQEVENNDISEQLRFAALHDCETKWKTCDSHGGAKDQGYVLIQLTQTDWTHTRAKTKAETADHTGSFSRGYSPKNLLRSVVFKLKYVDELLVEPAKLRAQWRWKLTISLSLARARSLFLSLAPSLPAHTTARLHFFAVWSSLIS